MSETDNTITPNLRIPEFEAVPVKSATQIDSKVGAGAFAGALGVLTVWGASKFGLDIPSEPAVAIGTVYAFVLGYIAK